jgi:hypothetical protein
VSYAFRENIFHYPDDDVFLQPGDNINFISQPDDNTKCSEKFIIEPDEK